jgi:hypothetical protein
MFAPRKPAWWWTTVAATVSALAVYLAWARIAPWRPARAGGLTFGTIAAAVFFVDALYPLRRRLGAWPFGTAQRWLQFHVYGGLFALACVFIHAGFAWPRGTMGAWLLGLSVWTVATGVAGVALQKWIPATISTTLRVVALAERIPEMTADLGTRADALMDAAPDPARAAYDSDLRGPLRTVAPAWEFVANPQGGLRRYDRSVDLLERVEPDRQRVAALRRLAREKAELDVHLSLQRALRVWLVFHVPASMALLGLLAVHLFAAWYF